MESEDRDNDMVDLVVVDGVLVELVDDDCSEYGVDAETVRSVMRDTVIPDMKKCYGCIACGGADHSHLTCVLVGAALHRWVRQWAPEKDMTLVVDNILRLLLWGWREAHFGEVVTCLSYTKLGDLIAAGSRSGRIFVMSAQTGEKRLCNVAIDHRSTHTKLTTRQRMVSHGEINCMAYSPSGDTVAVGYENGNVVIVQVTNGSVDSIDFTNYGSVDSIDFSPCGSQLAAACNDVCFLATIIIILSFLIGPVTIACRPAEATTKLVVLAVPGASWWREDFVSCLCINEVYLSPLVANSNDSTRPVADTRDLRVETCLCPVPPVQKTQNIPDSVVIS